MAEQPKRSGRSGRSLWVFIPLRASISRTRTCGITTSSSFRLSKISQYNYKLGGGVRQGLYLSFGYEIFELGRAVEFFNIGGIRSPGAACRDRKSTRLN